MIKEFDEIGSEKMFEKYGGGKSKMYYLEYNGKYYYQKLIVRAAYENSSGHSMKKSATITRRLLLKLGFVIVCSLVDLVIYIFLFWEID